MPGLFIAIEGIDGSGKTTVAELLATALTAAGRDVVITREPGGTAIGEQIRNVVLSESSIGMTPETETLLFAAARAQHVAEIIKPALALDRTVICDRYVDSSLAYQWGGRGMSMDSILAVQEIATDGIMPDLRVLLDVPVELAMRRIADSNRSNRLDNEQVQFYERVRAAYLALAATDSTSWLIVDAQRDAQDILLEVLQFVESARNLNFGRAKGTASSDWREPR